MAQNAKPGSPESKSEQPPKKEGPKPYNPLAAIAQASQQLAYGLDTARKRQEAQANGGSPSRDY